MKKYTLMIGGGIGKHICSTTMIRQIKEEDPEARITVVSGYPEVFLNNPKIHRNLHHMTSYIFDDYIAGTDCRTGEPYNIKDYYENKKHLSNVYPIAYRFKNENKDIYPEIYLNDEEKEAVEKLVSKSKYPVITLQATGGNQRVGQVKDPRKLTGRDLLLKHAQKIVDICNEEKVNVIQIALPHEYRLKNVMTFDLPFRRFMALIPSTIGHIGIDSAMMHAAAAFKKPALIFWNQTNVNALGYPYMTNVTRNACPNPMCSRPHVGMNDLVPEGVWKCPYDMACRKWTEKEVEGHIRKFIKKLKDDGAYKLPEKEITRIPL